MAFAATLIVGCDRSSDSELGESNPEAFYILGFNRNHDLRYIVYDSVVTILPDSQSITRDTTNLDISIMRGQDNNVELSVNGLPHDLFTIDVSGILHSGQIRPGAIPPDTLFFYPTPVIMPRFFTVGRTWSFMAPPYMEGEEYVKKSLLNLTYGYFTERTYLGRRDIVLPTGSYETYHFRSALFQDETSSDTMMTIDEYYSSGIGPVKILSRFGHSRRLILLLDDR
jgi:hypothetical protein